MKMKIAVIIGVVHMTAGVFIKASNSIYFKKWIEQHFGSAAANIEFSPASSFEIPGIESLYVFDPEYRLVEICQVNAS